MLLVEDRKKIALFFNSYQFSAAKDVADKLAKNLTGIDKALFECLSNLIEGYRLWDSFNHNEALKTLGQEVKKLSEYLNFKTDPILKDFAESAKRNLEFLKTIKGNKEATLLDLFRNAQRRSEEGKYDDAVARLYRTLEMRGQIEFEKQFGCSTSDAKIKKLPESLRDEMGKKHTAHNGKIKIPLYGIFAVLKEADNEFGKLFFKRREEMDRTLFARNSSILAHGLNPVSEETFKKLSSIVKDFLGCTRAERVESLITTFGDDIFPKLRWE